MPCQSGQLTPGRSRDRGAAEGARGGPECSPRSLQAAAPSRPGPAVSLKAALLIRLLGLTAPRLLPGSAAATDLLGGKPAPPHACTPRGTPRPLPAALPRGKRALSAPRLVFPGMLLLLEKERAASGQADGSPYPAAAPSGKKGRTGTCCTAGTFAVAAKGLEILRTRKAEGVVRTALRLLPCTAFCSPASASPTPSAQPCPRRAACAGDVPCLAPAQDTLQQPGLAKGEVLLLHLRSSEPFCF